MIPSNLNSGSGHNWHSRGKMLWSKEDTTNGSYIDIFDKSNDDQLSTAESGRNEADDRDFLEREKRFDHKFEEYAEECRDEGKKYYARKDFIKAMQEFNRCLMFARSGSQEISLAIANRSACFYHLNMPDECLRDIELAKASNYPADLQAKLDDRVSKCHELKKQDVKPHLYVIREPALSFWEHERYAGVADCLEIQQSDDKSGYDIRTICDLDIGQTVFVEPAFSIVPTKFAVQNRDRCFCCFNQLKNFITCRDCLKGFYCNNDCMERACHRIDCSVDVVRDDQREQVEIELLVKTFLIANAAFDDADNLMKIVDLLLRDGDNLPDDLTPAQRSFCFLFKLPNAMREKHSDEQLSELKRKAASAYQIVASFEGIKLKYSSIEQQRFIQHLIFHLFCIVGHAIDLNEPIRTDSKPFLAAYSLEHYASALYPVGCHIKHSCIPNVSWFSDRNRLVCTVIRPIKKGEQLFRSYL